MLGFLSYLFDIRKGEWNRLLLLYLFGLIFLTGITWGETISEAAFLAQVGTGVLPYTFIADAVIAVFAVAIYTVFVDRVGHDRLLIGIMLISAVIVLIGRILVGTSASILAYPFLYLGSHVIKDLFILHWWTYVNSFYDTQSAKRVVPFIATGARVAGIVAGFSMALLNRWLAPENIIFLWMGSLVLVALGVTLMPRLSPDDGSMPKIGETAKKEEKRGWRGYVANIREGVGYVRNSPYLRWIAISTLLLMTLLPLITYQTSQILKDQLQSTAAISSYVGNLTGITNLIMFPIQLFLMGRLIRRLGLGNTNMIYPTGTLLAVGSLVALPTALFSAGFAYFYRTTFRTSFRMTIDNLLYNAVPLKVKGRARAFTTGLLIPVGYLIGGILLLTLPALRGLPWLLPAILAALGIAYFLSSFIVTRLYSKALVTMLEQEDYSFLLQPAEDLNIVNIETMERLKKQAEESTSPEMTIFIAKLMSDVGGKTSIPALVGMARSENPTIRAAIANILIAADFRSSEVRGVLTNLLSDPEGVVRQSAVSYLSQWSDQGTDEIYGLALELLRDPEPEVRLQVIPILIRSGDIYFMAAAMQALSPLLTDSSPARRGAAVRLLAQFRDSRFIQSILPYMNDPDDEVRLEAAVSVEMLSERALPVRIERMLLEQGQALLTDPVERIRRAALVILGNLRLSQAQSVLISFLTDSSAEIRDTAVKALARGSDQITLTALLRVENQPNQLRKMLTVVLGKIDKEKAIEPIRAYIRANLIQVYTNLIRLEALEPCIAFQGISIIANLLRERNELLLEESFYLLSALHPPAEVQVIAESLVSDVARVRANAFEALETVLTPVLGRMFKPLYDKDLPKAKLLEVSHEYSGVKQGNAGTVLRTLGGDANDHWVRAIVVYALGEIGATAYPPPPDDAPSHEAATVISPKPSALPAPQAPLDPPKDRRARRGAGDLLSALETPKDMPEGKEPASSETKPETPKRRRSAADALSALGGEKTETTGKTEKSEKADHPSIVPTLPGEEMALATPSTDLPGLRKSPCATLFSKAELEAMIGPALSDGVVEVRLAARAARRMMSGAKTSGSSWEDTVLSTIEKIIFLKEVPFFAGMSVDQLKILASVCDEELFANDAVVFNEGDAGGALYVVVRGRVALEREGQRKGSTVRIATVEALSYFGELTLFENSPRTEKALALQDTLTLRLRREPLLALIRQQPDLSLKLINVLSRRLRESSDRIAALSQVRPRELHKVFDKLE